MYTEQLKLSQELEGARSKEFYWMNQLRPRTLITFELPDELENTPIWKEYQAAQAYVQECKQKYREFLINTKGFNEKQLKRLGL